MSQDAATQLRRLLHLIPTLADGETHPLDEVARRAGTDVETIRRDLYSLTERFGDPGGFIPGLSVMLDEQGVSVTAVHFHRPMRLTVAELAALELGLAMLQRESPPEDHPAITRARARLAQALVGLTRREVELDLRHAETGAAADPEHLRLLRSGVRQRRKRRIEYRSAGAAANTPRVVRPYGLIASRGAWYVVAHCEARRDVRIFRLDRIEAVERLDERFDVPRDFSLDEVVKEGRVFRADDDRTLRVRYSPHIARWIAEREGLPLERDGTLVAEHPLADTSWAIRHVLQYGPDAEVLEPEEVRIELAAVLMKTLERL